MSSSSDARRVLTLEDLEKFLTSPIPSSPVDAAAHYIDAAAVLAAFSPNALQPVGRRRSDADDFASRRLVEVSEPILEGPQHGMWNLSFLARRDALRRLATRERMRQALDANPDRPETTLQHVFERVVNGDCVALNECSRDELAALITVIGWLEGIVDGLPEEGNVRSALAKADLLAPMRRLAGRGFVGRQRALEQLDHYAFTRAPPRAPLFVFGPGGVGKSTLLARFVLDNLMPKNVPFVYIDIDRPTVRPDRPLTLLLEAISQLQLQLDRPLYVTDRVVKEIVNRINRQEAGRQFESFNQDFPEYLTLFKATFVHDSRTPPQRVVFFVDTFEEAQFLGPDVVWQVIEFLFALSQSDAAFRVIIAGRALPEEFISQGFPYLNKTADHWFSEERPIERIPVPERPVDLGVLDKGAARELLQSSIQLAGLPPIGEDDLNDVIGIVGRNPMCLKLAARLLRDEGVEKLREARSELLVKLKAEKIQALLYGRILSHVHGEDVRKVAYPGLIVRRITAEVIRDVLARPCGLALSAKRCEQQIFLDLAKEAALVELDPTDGSLRHRVDVRRAMLADMIDHVEPQVIEQIDQAAVAFYKAQPGAVARAEEIYHRLRLRESEDILNERWSPEDGLAVRLKGAGEELPAQQRLWLAKKLGITLDDSVRQVATQEAWEDQAARSADRYLQSGAAERALSVLRERSERLPQSTLYSLEAEALRFMGTFEEALAVARSGVEAASKAGATDLALDLLLKMVVIEETQARLEQAYNLLNEADAVATYSHNEILRLRVKITRLRVQRQLRPEARKERTALRSDALSMMSEKMLFKLQSHPVLLREVAAELGKEDARIVKAAIDTLGMEVENDAQAIALGKALATLNKKGELILDRPYVAFDTNNPFYQGIREISVVRASQPALRYGGQYFRQVSGSGREFEISQSAPGIIAFSRILNDREVVIVANAFTNTGFSGFVLVDFSLNPDGSSLTLLYSNKGRSATPPGAVITRDRGTVVIREIGGGTNDGPCRAIPFTLQPMEIQILGRPLW